MYLKRIEMKGFKSFADKTIMDFGQGITAVVGPNGSGKSNIADAVRWVLGEQSAKALRGSRMEDVIFTGTRTRKALGFAEVSITIDNKDGRLPIDYSEVMVTRRVYRSGESEFYINKTGCRLKDINELFMDTGVGKEGYSIIGQGRIDEILSTKSEDRRRVLEEAAGIVKYKIRKEEAERKLETTRENLVRLNDITEELERQLEPLSEQSAKAGEFIKLRDSLRELEINVFINSIERLNAQKTKLAEKVKEYQRAIYERNNAVAGLEAARGDLENRAAHADQELGEMKERLYSTINLMDKKENEIKLLSQRIESENDNIDIYNKEIERIKAEIGSARAVEEQKKLEYQQLKSILDEKKRLLEAFQLKLEALSIGVGEKEEKIEELKSQIIENMNTISDLNSRLNGLKSINESISARSAQLVEEIKALEKSIKNLEQLCEDFADRLRETVENRRRLQEKLGDIEKQAQKHREQVRIETERHIKVKNRLRTLAARLDLLMQMENEYEGYSRSVKGVMEECGRNSELADGIIGPVAGLIRCKEGLETAIEVALGHSLQNIVTRNEDDAKRAIDYLKKNKLGRATFLPITSVKPRYLSSKETRVESCNGFLGIGSHLVYYDPSIKGIIESLLGRVVIADNLDNGINMAKEFGYSFKIVTVDGEVLNPGGSITGGSNQSKEIGLLQRKKEIDSIRLAVERLSTEAKTFEQRIEQLKQNIGQLDREIEITKSQIHSADIEEIKQNQALEAKTDELADKKGRLTELGREKAELEANYNDTEAEITQLQGRIRGAELENRERQEKVRALQRESGDDRQDRDNILQQITSYRVEAAKLGQRLEDMKNNTENLVQNIQRLQLSVMEREKDIELSHNNIRRLESRIDCVKEEIKTLIAEKDGMSEQIKKLQLLKGELQQRLKEKDEAIKTINRDISALEEKYRKSEVELTRAEIELSSLHNRMWEEYEMTYIKALDYKKQIKDMKNTTDQINDLRQRIKTLGDVNLGAIEEYARVKDRYQFLKRQIDDLVSARDSLNRIIREMTDTMKEQFSAQLEIIDCKFDEVFKELFGGGKARLTLTDEQNVLESGIDIIASPPGKKLQHLSLLSGGERALTAIALLFAIIMVKPTPFCILDEIEAALDDANVERFSSFLKRLSGDTQFIIITHRKGTMEEADCLYGITMEEKGISKLISVKLEDRVS